jgi:signal peptidase I
MFFKNRQAYGRDVWCLAMEPVLDTPMTHHHPLKKRLGQIVIDNIKTLLGAILIAATFRTVFVEPFTIPSESMLPGLVVGDYLFVSKWSYGYGPYSAPYPIPALKGRIWNTAPKRGDVAVFRNPNNPSVSFIKRIVGLPHDTVQVIDGSLYINDTLVQRTPTTPFEDMTPLGPIPADRYIETMSPTKSYAIIEKDGQGGVYDDTPPYVIPEGYLFAMGDNRDRSADSRTATLGLVPMDNLIGRAEFILMSLGDGAHWWELWRIPFSLRYHRFFTRIQ